MIFDHSLPRIQKFHVFMLLLALVWGCLQSSQGSAERIKDLTSIQGVRSNQLIGYGLVVGLDGSGDMTTQTPFTVQSIISMLGQMGALSPMVVTLLGMVTLVRLVQL